VYLEPRHHADANGPRQIPRAEARGYQYAAAPQPIAAAITVAFEIIEPYTNGAPPLWLAPRCGRSPDRATLSSLWPVSGPSHTQLVVAGLRTEPHSATEGLHPRPLPSLNTPLHHQALVPVPSPPRRGRLLALRRHRSGRREPTGQMRGSSSQQPPVHPPPAPTKTPHPPPQSPCESDPPVDSQRYPESPVRGSDPREPLPTYVATLPESSPSPPPSRSDRHTPESSAKPLHPESRCSWPPNPAIGGLSLFTSTSPNASARPCWPRFCPKHHAFWSFPAVSSRRQDSAGYYAPRHPQRPPYARSDRQHSDW